MNSYWDNLLNDCNAIEKQEVQRLLGLLSRNVDDLTRRLKDEVVQVRTESRNPMGLFDFRFLDSELLAIFGSEFSSIKSYEDFIEKAFATCRKKTEISMANVREYVTQDLKNEFVQLLTRLQADLRAALAPGVASGLLGAVANGLTAIQNECDRIARWFTFSEVTFEAFGLREIVNVCVASVNNVNPAVQISPTIDVDPQMIKGEYFHSFFDILRTLLDNAQRHSGLAGAAPTVNIIGRIRAQSIEILMRNTITDHVRENDPVGHLTDRLRKIQSGGISDEIRKEGGTGYVKIAKIVAYDLKQTQANVKFSYPTNGEFEISLEFDGKEILA